MVLSIFLLVTVARGTEVEFQIDQGILNQPAALNCKYNLGDRNLLHLLIYKGVDLKKDENRDKNTIVFVSNAANSSVGEGVWKNPKSPLIDRVEFELNQDVDDWRIATVRITDVQLEDKGDYTCVITTSTADNPVWDSSEQSGVLDVFYPPSKISFTPVFDDDGVMTASCEVDSAYPEPVFDIPWVTANSVMNEQIITEDDKIVKSFQYPISPANANEEIRCEVAHSAMAAPLEDAFTIQPPLLPDVGSVIEELVLDEYTLNNAARLIDTLDFSNTTDNGVLRISAYSMEEVNGTCSVSLTASIGAILPAAKIIWYVDNDRKSDGDTFSIESDQNGNDTLVTVIGDSFVGRVALQYNYRDGCFPTLPPTVSTSTVDPEIKSPGLRQMETVTETVSNNSSDESLPEGSGFSHPEDVDGVQMSGAIIASIVASTIAIILMIGAIIYFLCFAQKEKTVYRPNDKGDSGSMHSKSRSLSRSLSKVDDLTASIDMNDVVQVKSKSSVQRTLSGTWNKPSEEASLLQVNNNSNVAASPRRTVSTQTLEGKVDTMSIDEVTLKETPVYGSTRSVHV